MIPATASLEALRTRRPVHFITKHRCKFFEIDPYGHLNTNHYVTHFLEHRFTGLRETTQLDLATLVKLPVGFFTNKIEVQFLRPLQGDEEFEIDSYTAEIDTTTALVLGEARKLNGKAAASFKLGLTCVDKATGKPCAWPADVIERFFHKD